MRVKKRREEIERGRGSVTSAITSSEMHLDRVSICQNKAASTAASLMAMDVNDRGGGEMEGVALAHSKRHTRLLLHAHKSHTQTQQLQLLFFFFRLQQIPPII